MAWCSADKNKKVRDYEAKHNNQPEKYPNNETKPYPPPPKNPNPYKWSKKDVCIWLASFGMQEYQENFDNEQIDGELLMQLKKDDYHDLGIYSMGHRKKIQKKVKELKSQSKYSGLDEKTPYGQNGQFNEQQYLQTHPKQFTKDKTLDKNQYFDFWQELTKEDFLLQPTYEKLMTTSGLTHKDIKIIWKMGTQHKQGKCFFENFAIIMKLTVLSQMNVPLYLINVPKLVFYHPGLPNFNHESSNKNVDRFLRDQVAKNTIEFLHLPLSVLESDDRLMELEKLALRKHKPIHFEINQDKLIATFSNEITNINIKDLKEQTIKVLTHTMGFHSKIVSNVMLKRPNKNDINGITPGGPSLNTNSLLNTSQLQPQSQQPLINNGNDIYNSYNNSTSIKSPINNGHHNNGINNLNNTHLQQNNGVIQSPYSPAPPIPRPNSPQIKMTETNQINDENEADDDEEDYEYEKPETEEARQELMMKLLLSDNFWNDFVKRTNLHEIVSKTEKIKPKIASKIIAKLRGIQQKDINMFADTGVKAIHNKTIEKLEFKLNNPNLPLNYIGALLGIPDQDIPEVYVGVVIEGLPLKITDDDDNIRRLDKAVLQDFIVSHIEVADDTLNISFGCKMTQENIGMLRKYLKKFLKEDIRLEKKEMRNVSIIPHTKQTWKRETQMDDEYE